MPRTCRACSSPKRTEIDGALVAGEPLRNISKRVSISPAALLRHKTHAGQAIVKAAERREESIGESVLSRLESLYRRGEKILSEAERSGDGRLALQAIRESREVLAGVFTLANKAAEAGRTEADPSRVQIVHIGEAPTHRWIESGPGAGTVRELTPAEREAYERCS